MIIVMPMAGRGSRFSDKGFDIPKPFIHVYGKPIFRWALDTLVGLDFSKFIIVALRSHASQFEIEKYIPDDIRKKTHIVLLDAPTEGQLCTVLECKPVIKADEDLLIISSDTYVKSNLGIDISKQRSDSKGIISVANLPGDRWSFAKTDGEGKVIEVTEKVRISDHASTGLYYFRYASDFISIGEEMLRSKEMQKGEYYVMPVYQKLIERGGYVSLSMAEEIIDLGTPEALKMFLDKNGKFE